MSRDYFINGESLVLVKATGLNLSQLGLAAGPIRITPNYRHMDINVDAWGQAPADVQWMLADANISMTLIHFDRGVLDTCLGLSQGGTPVTSHGAPTFARAGIRLGGGVNSLAAGNSYIRLNITSPVSAGPTRPWLFYSTYLTGPPMEFPLGTEKSMVQVNWRAVPYTLDPYTGAGPANNAGTGAGNFILWDYTNDTN